MRAGSDPPNRAASHEPALEAKLIRESLGVALIPASPLTDHNAVATHEDTPATGPATIRAVAKQGFGRADVDHGPSPVLL
jgi:hypothetical protein